MYRVHASFLYQVEPCEIATFVGQSGSFIWFNVILESTDPVIHILSGTHETFLLFTSQFTEVLQMIKAAQSELPKR